MLLHTPGGERKLRQTHTHILQPTEWNYAKIWIATVINHEKEIKNKTFSQTKPRKTESKWIFGRNDFGKSGGKSPSRVCMRACAIKHAKASRFLHFSNCQVHTSHWMRTKIEMIAYLFKKSWVKRKTKLDDNSNNMLGTIQTNRGKNQTLLTEQPKC